jgi:TorA maturation chaperone TorD
LKLGFGIWDFKLLSHLWLHEPDAEIAARAHRELGLPLADPRELARAYADVLLLNVPPYGTVFTDPEGELNSLEAQRAAALYESYGYHPSELLSVGAPDHLGLCLGFVAHAEETGMEIEEFVGSLFNWIPVCCLAVEHEPTQPFYQALAAKTCQGLLERPAIHSPQHIPSAWLQFSHLSPDDELSLRDLVRFFLTPARCGVFLSRSRLGRMALNLGLRLPFSSRFEVAEMLFTSAGEAGQIEPLLAALEAEVETWAAEYRSLADKYPVWQPHAEVGVARTTAAVRALHGMRQVLLAFSS